MAFKTNLASGTDLGHGVAFRQHPIGRRPGIGAGRKSSIEAETDRRHLAIWDLDGAATARLGDDLRAVIDAIPT